MTEKIHYLVRHPSKLGQFTYPSDIDDPQYFGVGGFFILGGPRSRLAQTYQFEAVLGDAFVTTELIRFGESGRLLIAQVPEVGRFLFSAERVSGEVTRPNDRRYDGVQIAWRLRSWRPDELERVCKEREFYFVGYSPSFERQEV